MIPTTRTPRRLVPPWAWLCLLLAGCGRVDGAEAKEVLGARVRHLTLQVQGPGPEPTLPVVVREITVPRDLPDWKFEGTANVGVLQRPLKNFRTLRLAGEERLRVTIPGQFMARGFNQVAVTLKVEQQRSLAVDFLRDGTMLRRSHLLPAMPTRDPLTLVFDLPSMQRERAVFDALSIWFPAQGGYVDLISVALVNKPHHQWLPDPAGAPAPVAIDGEWRPAVGLSNARPLSTTFKRRPNARFEFDWGVPEGVRVPHVPLELEVRLEDQSGHSKQQRVPIETDMAVRSEWKSVSIGVDEFDGTVSVTFRLLAPAGQEAHLALGEPRLVRRSEQAPTVVLITSDAHRADHVGASNSGVDVATPFLDELALRGVMFEDCSAPSNETHPSLTALMTGLSPRDTGILADTDTLSGDARTLAERFRVAGFLTFASVSFGSLGPGRSGLEQGFDRFSAPHIGLRDSAQTLAAVGDWLARSEGLPVFVWLHVADAHTPYDPPEGWRRRYYDLRRDPRDRALEEPPEWMLPKSHSTVRDPEFVMALYRSEISYLDDQLSRLLSYGRFQTGVVAFTADYGESLTAHDVYFAHDELYPDTLAVPLIVTAPGLSPRRESRPVAQIDLGRTLLQLAGVRDATFPGTDLLPTATDRFGLLQNNHRERPRFALSAGGLSASVFYKQRFFVLHLRRHRLTNPTLPPIKAHEVELYDLAEDPECLDNLASERHDEAAELRALIIDWLREAQPRGLSEPSLIGDSATIEALATMEFSTNVRRGTVNSWFEDGCSCDRCAPFE